MHRNVVDYLEGQRDETSGELTKSKTYADGNFESVTIVCIRDVMGYPYWTVTFPMHYSGECCYG